MSRNNTLNVFQSIRLGAKIDDQISSEDINMVDEEGGTLLHEAIAYKNILTAETLINSGLDVDKANANGMTPLHYAAQYKDYETAGLILPKSKRPDSMDNHGNSPLWTAVLNARGDYKMVNLFIKFGMNPSSKNLYGKSPLDFAYQLKEQGLIAALSNGISG